VSVAVAFVVAAAVAAERSETRTLSGVVESQQGHEPVAGARVALLDGAGTVLAETRTDSEGRFTIASPSADVRVRVEHPDHAAFARKESIPRRGLDIVYVLAPPSAGELMVVEEERQRNEVARRVVDAEMLRLTPGAFGDPIRALQGMPGVARARTLEGTLVVRGAEGVNTQVYVDEMPVPFLFHMFGGRSVIAPSFVDDVEFYPGGMPARFGQVTQAVLNVRTDRELPQRRQHVLDVSIFDAGWAGTWNGDRVDLRVGLRQSWASVPIAAFSTIASASADGLVYVYPGYSDLFATLDVSDRARWTAQIVGSHDAISIHVPEADEEIVKDEFPYNPLHPIDSAFLRGRLRRRLALDGRSVDSWLAIGPHFQKNILGDLWTGPLSGPTNGRWIGFMALARHEEWVDLDPRARLVWGLNATGEYANVRDYRDIFDADGTIHEDTDLRLDGGAFAELQFRPHAADGHGWLLSPGLRASGFWFHEDPYFEPEPRLTVRKDLSHHVTLDAFVGHFAQMPPLVTYAQDIGLVEPPLMRAWQGSFGAEWRSGRWSGSSTLYGTRIGHVIVQREDVEVTAQEGGALEPGNETDYLDTTGWSAGLENQVKLGTVDDRLWLEGGLTLARSIRELPSGSLVPSDYDAPWAVSLVGAYQLPKKWVLSARVRVAAGYPFTPQRGAHDLSFDAWNGIPQDWNSDRYPYFKQLDVRVQKTWQARRSTWSWYLDLYNATNAKNPIVTTYNANYTELDVLAYLPIIPSIGVEVKF
jgi:hypothetical protein